MVTIRLFCPYTANITEFLKITLLIFSMIVNSSISAWTITVDSMSLNLNSPIHIQTKTIYCQNKRKG